MTHITSHPTKKSFREAIATNPAKVYLSDPAIINPISGRLDHILAERSPVYVTNHPKRSWYAQVSLKPDGKIEVK